MSDVVIGTICAIGHDRVIFRSDTCPLCLLIAERDRLRAEVISLRLALNLAGLKLLGTTT